MNEPREALTGIIYELQGITEGGTRKQKASGVNANTYA